MKFCTKILKYYLKNQRDLQWRKTKDPYKIWLSEIIMQQTQISQGTAYYHKFIKTYPTVFDIAKANEQDILLLWQGLGYYSRARNLHHTAKEIVAKYYGVFPNTYKELVQFKGIGDYTASAILSICFNKVYPAIDGNILRVISRLFNISEPINKPSGKKIIAEKCKTLICTNKPGDFNQALMDFGSMHCTPSKPACDICIFKNECLAFQTGNQNNLPFKLKPKAKTKEYFNYFIFIRGEDVLIKKRTAGIWKNLYEFPLITSNKKISIKGLSNQIEENISLKTKIKIVPISERIKHILSHKVLFVQFYLSKIITKQEFTHIVKSNDFQQIKIKNLNDYPLPQVIRTFLSDNLLDSST